MGNGNRERLLQAVGLVLAMVVAVWALYVGNRAVNDVQRESRQRAAFDHSAICIQAAISYHRSNDILKILETIDRRTHGGIESPAMVELAKDWRGVFIAPPGCKV